ncbi:MAG: alpha-ketoglutarate-dependent dioxygenase AlkB [Acidobacteriaceae bacterium]|nr:alpha-ketoglutarate-dependent dioxygenase AlkB [Acidobacteriaceae bacterium]
MSRAEIPSGDEKPGNENCFAEVPCLIYVFMARWRPAAAEELPKGFLYREEFLSEAEEAELSRIFGALEFAPYDYHGYLAKRRVVRYGVSYDINTQQQHENTPPIPEFLLSIRKRAAEAANVVAEDLAQAMVSEYSPGTPIGWHRDAPQFGTIIGISLGSACRLRLKPYQGAGKILSLQLEPRSIYVLGGLARSGWEHSIPPVEQLRYSITFRTLRSKGTAAFVRHG